MQDIKKVKYTIVEHYRMCSPSVGEKLQNIDTNIFKDMPSDRPVCSLVQADWTDSVSSLSTNSDCFCPVGNKASNTINNTTFYKCQIPYPTTS